MELDGQADASIAEPESPPTTFTVGTASAGSTRESAGMSEQPSVIIESADSTLRLATPDELTIRRQRRGRGFIYLSERGTQITDKTTLQRIRSLAIPPAYEDVRIAADPDAHLQATGRDEAGRTQYRYHPGWEDVREERKVERLAEFCAALPRIRRRVANDLKRPAPSRRKALAAVILLIDETNIRIGGEDYVHSGRSRGAATLLKRNVARNGDRLCLTFRGKGGQQFRCEVASPALLEAYEELLALRGARLFQYRNGSGKLRPVTAADVNLYLQEVSGTSISAKDFRTLAATSAAAERLLKQEPAPSSTARRRQIAGVMREISELLGNTPTVARKSYVHRRLITAFEQGELARLFRRKRSRYLSRGESAVAGLFAAAMRRRRRNGGAGPRRETTTPAPGGEPAAA